MEKARVFISCGQANEDEKKFGIEASNWFREKGFEPYFAEEYSTPEGLTENIFKAIRESEYFIVINFERDNSQVGSLFVQQELAIASFLKIPMIGFQVGDIKLEGIEKYILLNGDQIKSIEDMIKILEKKTEDWNSTSKNQLFLSFGNHHPDFTFMDANWKPLVDKEGKEIKADFYHIIVNNKSNFKNALDCYGYIESIHDLDKNEPIFKDEDYKTELLWAGAGDIKINIPIKGKRDLDAFHYHQKLDKILFNQRSTSSNYRYPIINHGKYEIVYVIISENMPIARFKIKIKFKDRINILNSCQI